MAKAAAASDVYWNSRCRCMMQCCLWLLTTIPLIAIHSFTIALPIPSSSAAAASPGSDSLKRGSSSRYSNRYTATATNSMKATSVIPTTETTATSANRASFKEDDDDEVIKRLVDTFSGDFDNYDQVVEDRNTGMLAGVGGGHENIHCCITRATHVAPAQIMRSEGVKEVVSAKYYFYGRPEIVFRYRLYSFHPCTRASGSRGNGAVEMRLWRLLPPIEAQLRQAGYRLDNFKWEDDDVTDNLVAESMDGCEIFWHSVDKHDGHLHEEDDGDVKPPLPLFLGLMGEDDDGCWITSQVQAGMEILVKDDLKLFADQLWVNDRGFDRKGAYVYGNQRNVPYKMKRVLRSNATSLSTPSSTSSLLGAAAGEETVGGSERAKGPLEWTLGGAFRTAEEYAAKMKAIGVDVTVNMARPTSSSPPPPLPVTTASASNTAEG